MKHFTHQIPLSENFSVLVCSSPPTHSNTARLLSHLWLPDSSGTPQVFFLRLLKLKIVINLLKKIGLGENGAINLATWIICQSSSECVHFVGRDCTLVANNYVSNNSRKGKNAYKYNMNKWLAAPKTRWPALPNQEVPEIAHLPPRAAYLCFPAPSAGTRRPCAPSRPAGVGESSVRP